jgi:hypothetical protein
MKTRMLSLFMVLSLAAMAAIYGFTAGPNSASEYALLVRAGNTHGAEQRFAAAKRSETAKLQCYLAHGYREIPFNEEIFRRFIGSDEDGAGICGQ